MSVVLNNFLTEIKELNSIAIIGLSKNAGKTTTMNAILKLLNYEKVALTSIGYDGEDNDLVFNTHKPNIFIKKGMLIATAKKCVLESTIQFKILETTGFNTPLGEIIIVEALEDGLVKLAGPSYNAQLKEVIKLLKSFKDSLVIVDGALNRKTFSDPSVCDGTILCSGMNIANNINEVVAITSYTLKNLQTKKLEANNEIFDLKSKPLVIFDKELNQNELKVKTTINADALLLKQLNKSAKYLFVNGPLTDKLAQAIIRHRNNLDNITIVLNNATNNFIKEKSAEQLALAKIKVRVLHEINVVAVAMNPNSLHMQYDSKELCTKMRKETNVFVYDFVKGE
ncbi:hypothetical protein [Mycoplasma sp. P36-A1]|uniref:lysine 5,6-aminomutase reactivase subunit KamB n=1 Tax=Mycoplasma sp. P36-A1 TaxID=3252900 RepID=UPI003C2D03B9